MKYILSLFFTGFISAETFKSWEADFEFTHFEYGKFKMQREFISQGDKISTGAFVPCALISDKTSMPSCSSSAPTRGDKVEPVPY